MSDDVRKVKCTHWDALAAVHGQNAYAHSLGETVTAAPELARLTLNLATAHTDATGSDELNQRLSEQRAETVREYLVKQGLDGTAITAKGFGKTVPVADNTNATGRQKNRRVELVVSGEMIGVRIGG